MTTILISLGLIAIFWIVSKLQPVAAKNDAFLTQLKFIQIYMADGTDGLFHNMSKDKAIELGQDILYAEARRFNKSMQRAVIEQQPVQMGDMSLLISAIKIIKAAESMVFIQDNGPINYEDDEPSGSVRTGEDSEQESEASQD